MRLALDGRHAAVVDRGFALTWDESTRSAVFGPRIAYPLAPPRQLVRAFLGGLLPEPGTAARSALARRRGVDSADVSGLLTNAGDLPGAVAVWSGEMLPPVVEAVDDDVVAQLLSDPAGSDAVETTSGVSLPGVQPKITLRREPDGGWAVVRGSALSTHILKPVVAERPELVHSEAWCSRLALRLGLGLVASTVERIGGVDALVVPRFDRVRVDDVVRARHQVDAAQALGLTPDDIEAKFEWHRPAANLRAIAQLLDAGERGKLLALATLWVGVGNTDGHTKNVSLLIGTGGASLAPAYDISPHTPYGSGRLAMSVGGEFGADAVSAAHLVDEGRSWRLGLRAQTVVHSCLSALAEAVAAERPVMDHSAVLWPLVAHVTRRLDSLQGGAAAGGS